MITLQTGTLYQAIEKQRKIKLAFFLSAIILLLATIVAIQNIFISFLIAFVIYFSLAPIVDFLERKGLSRQWSTTIPFAILIVLSIVSLQIFSPILISQINTLKSSLPSSFELSTKFLESMELQVHRVLSNIYPVDFRGKLEPLVTGFIENIFSKIPTYISQSITILLLTPFFAYFMLLDGRSFVRKILSLVPNNFFELALNLSHQISDQLGGFIRARMIESFLVSAVIWIGLSVIGFPFALLLAIFAGILNIIPYLGPFIGAAPALILCIANSELSSSFPWLVLVYALAQIIDIALIVPFVVARIVNLHPVTVVLAVIIGSHLMGVLGMIICIPVFSVIKVSATAIYKHLTGFRS